MISNARYADLNGRVALVTGGASGIGATIVEAFAEQGCKVCFFDSDAVAGELLARELASRSRAEAVEFRQVDVRDVEPLESVIADAAKRFGGLDILVNNAADDQRHKLEEIDPGYWDTSFAVNLKHHFFATRAAAKAMAGRGGSVVCMGSIAWINDARDLTCYVTAKAALHGLVRALARELGPYRVRVNAVLPGWTMTEKQQRLWVDDEARRLIMEKQCLKRYLNPVDIARMVLFLASDESGMCTHQTFVVDGGWV